MLVQARGSLGAVAFILALTPASARAEPAVPMHPAAGYMAGPDSPTGHCAVVDQGRQARRKPRRGVLGWLYRYTRNIDVERGSTPLPIFLRSPLLTAVPAPADCGSESDATRADECAVIVVMAEKDEAVTHVIALPQMGATTPARLAVALRNRLADGETVELRTSSGGTVALLPARVRRIDSRNCVVDA